MENQNPEKLTDAKGLLVALFDEGSRPCERWLELQRKRRTVPFLKIGGMIRFDVARVREALTKKCTVQARKDGAA